MFSMAVRITDKRVSLKILSRLSLAPLSGAVCRIFSSLRQNPKPGAPLPKNSSRMATEQAFQVTSGGKERVERTIQALMPAFRVDPVYTWLLHTFNSSERDLMRQKLFHGFFTQCALNNGLFIEAGDFGSCGVFMPPGASAENPWTLLKAGLLPALWNIGFGTFKRAMLEYAPATEHMKKKVFSKEEQKTHWYIFIMGTSVDFQRRGLGSTLIKNVQERARVSRCPIWLEATTETSLSFYLKHDFENHGEIVLGKGSVGRDGLPKKAGEGIVMWSMSWRP